MLPTEVLTSCDHCYNLALGDASPLHSSNTIGSPAGHVGRARSYPWKKMTKIAIVTQGYPDPTQIPASNHIKNLFGGDSVVICRSARPELGTNRPYLVASTGAARADWPAVVGEQLPNVLSGLSGRVPVGRNRLQIEAFLKAHSVEHVLAEFGTEGVWIWPVVKRLGLPFHVYFRGYDATAFLEHKRRRSGRVRAYRAMLAQADTVFSVSQFLYRQLEKHGLNLSGSLVIPSGVDTSRFRPTQKDPDLLVAAGRFIEKKAPDLTVRAFARAVFNNPRARLEFIGDGPLLENCQRMVSSMGLDGRVIFHGHKDHHFVCNLLNRASIFLQHSIVAPNGDQEGAPTSIQEAMAAGAHVISTRHAGIPDLVVDGETGTLVDEGDEDGFVEAISEALANADRTRFMGEAGRLRAKARFDLHLSNSDIEAAIDGKELPEWRYFKKR